MVPESLLCKEELDEESTDDAPMDAPVAAPVTAPVRAPLAAPGRTKHIGYSVSLDHAYSKPEELPASLYSVLSLDLQRPHKSISFGLRISGKSNKFMVTDVAAGSPADTAGFMFQVCYCCY